MPVEVRELVIKAVVDASSQGKDKGRGSLDESEREAIISDCVEEVMRILKVRAER